VPQVGVHALVPELGRHGGPVVPVVPGRVVHQHIGRPHARFEPLESAPQAGNVPQVGHLERNLAAAAAVHQCLRRRGIKINKAHPRTLLGERPHDLGTNAGGASGHEDALVFQAGEGGELGHGWFEQDGEEEQKQEAGISGPPRGVPMERTAREGQRLAQGRPVAAGCGLMMGCAIERQAATLRFSNFVSGGAGIMTDLSIPRPGFGATLPGLPDLLTLFMHTSWCATALISNTFLECHGTLFNDHGCGYPAFCRLNQS
jgi:hypothetical protein